MDHQDSIIAISQTILSELAHFDQTFIVRSPGNNDVLSSPDDLGSITLVTIRNSVNESQKRLLEEPFIAYVKAEIDGQERILFICREYTPSHYTPCTSNSGFASYRSPLGRAAEIDIGEEFEFSLKQGRDIQIRTVRVLEKNLFRPEKHDSKWDGISDRFFLDSGTYTLPSLLEFLKTYQANFDTQPAVVDVEAVAERERRLYEILQQQSVIKEGHIREVINKMALRDQPILDSAQGVISRYPLSSQLIITGAPGTGKTTLLIKRIALYSSPHYLSEEQRDGLHEQQIAPIFHAKNWLLFTPTQLLRIYLKEALAKDGLPASDETVKVWDEEQQLLSRGTLRIVGPGSRYQRSHNPLIKVKDNAHLIAYAKKFIAFACRCFREEFQRARATLKLNKVNRDLLKEFTRIHHQVRSTQQDHEAQVLSLLDALSSLRETCNQMRQQLKEHVQQVVDDMISSKGGILQAVYDAMQSSGADIVPTEPSDEDEEIEESESEPETTDTEILARRQITKTITWLAEHVSTSHIPERQDVQQDPLASIRSLGREPRDRVLASQQLLEKIAPGARRAQREMHGRVLAVIGSVLPPTNMLVEIGKRTRDQKAVERVTRGYQTLFDRIPLYYQQFRIQQLQKKARSMLNKKYEDDIKRKKFSNPELDLLMFVMFKSARAIFHRHRDWLEGNAPIRVLEAIKSTYRTQVLIDEATDFSTLQLGCMFYLADPRYRSVSFSGDLMQRVTQFGLRDWSECQFISPHFEQFRVDKVYRQSPKLLRIAAKLYEKMLGQPAPFHSAFNDSDSDPSPLQFCTHGEADRLGEWLAERIVEIYKVNDRLPSTAIFVADDDQIEAVRRIIEEPLDSHAISVKGCPEGEILGSEGKVRIFSVKYIKGLEFESVFFVNLDQISKRTAGLLDKYLYVGLTRAASFLGVTYTTDFPKEIHFVRDDFQEGDWSFLPNPSKDSILGSSQRG